MTKYRFLEKKPILSPIAEGHYRFETELAKENNLNYNCKKNTVYVLNCIFLEIMPFYIIYMQFIYTIIIYTDNFQKI